MDISDERLIEGVIEGNEGCFDQIVERYVNRIYNFVFQITRDVDVSHDITQDTFVKVWKNVGRFNPARKFKTWIYHIAKNTAFDHLKKKKSIPFSQLTDEEGNCLADNVPAESEMIGDILDRAATAALLDQLIESLEPFERTVITLHYREELSLKEISDVMESSYNTIKSRHHRALKKLQDRSKTLRR